MYTVYLIENRVNNKRYVGCTKYSVKHRFETHCKDALYHNGGTSGYVFTEDDKKKLGNSMRLLYENRRTHNPDKERQRIEKIKQSNSVVLKSYLHKKHLSESGLSDSDKYCEVNNGFYGKHYTHDTRQYLSDTRSKQVKMYDKDRNLIKTFDSGKEASEWLIKNNYCKSININSSISQSVQNSFKRTTCGFFWSR